MGCNQSSKTVSNKSFSKYHEKIPWSELYKTGLKNINLEQSPDKKHKYINEDENIYSNDNSFLFNSDTDKSFKAKKSDKARERKDFEKIQSEYLKAERIKKEAEVEKRKAKIAREEAETDRKKARLERENAERIRQDASNEREKAKKNVNESKDEMEDPYSVLGVDKTDSLETIKYVYRNLIKIYHPDRYDQYNISLKQQRSNKTRKINIAYEWIKKHHRTI
jgi:DnaJ-domain-containing protein 1